jgi:hypothetical protein
VTIREHVGTYRVIGDKPDVEMFHYLVALIKASMDNSYDAWKRTQQAVGRGAKPNFQLAFANAIANRLRDMKHEQKQERDDAVSAAAKLLNKDERDIRVAVSNGDMKMLTNTALVIASVAEQKRKVVGEAAREAYKNVRLGTTSGFNHRSGTSAADAGGNAGRRLGLGRPVSGNNTRALR